MRRSTRTISSILREIKESSSGSSDEESDNNSEVENVNEAGPSTSRAQRRSSSEENEEGQGLGQYAVTSLVQRYYNGGRNVTCDRYFTSMPLANTLAANKTTLVGTIMSNKRCIPPELLHLRGRKEESSVFAFENKTTLVSYMPKPRKTVLLLSTQHHSNDTDVEEKNKPEIILFYNETKGAVDTVDWMVEKYSCKRKTQR